MKKILSLIALYLSISAYSEEGMWLPHLLESLNQEQMEVLGLEINSEDLYSISQNSIKDAIVSLGGFCTAEIISDQGLLLTNHHCAFDVIQEHSSVEDDFLTNGFWAKTKSEELLNEGLTATIVISIEDVTNEIVKNLNEDMSEEQRDSKIREISNAISKEKTLDTHYKARVKSFFGGNEFYLFTYETFKDVRLVGAPPSSIGKYGGDTDNWMWPRHTGDFALLRIYSDINGKPASYSKENIPYKPKHHLPIQLDGVENGDYSMVYGFPGRTNRYLTSFGIKEDLELSNPTIIEIRDKKLKIMKSGMDKNPETKIKYASKYASTSNYWKYYIGQSKGLKKMKVYDKKLIIEAEFQKWADTGSEERRRKYSTVLNSLDSAYSKNSKIQIARTYLNEAVFQGAEILYLSYMLDRRISLLPKDDEERDVAIQEIKNYVSEDFYKNYDATVDEELFSAMLKMYYYNVPEDQHPPIMKKIKNQPFGRSLNFEYYAKKVYEKSFLSSEEKCLNFLKNPSKKRLISDPAYKTMMSIYNYYMKNHAKKRKLIREEMARANRLFIQGLRDMDPEKKYYPDANSTLRLTYGTVGDYAPGDAMHYDYFTTIDGIFEKEDPKNEEFIVPEKLSELYKNKDYGDYADKDGNLRVNFIHNNDITGGNSGSPVINAWGELIGVAFDGNWEAMSGDIAFENNVQRTISVDIRYVLFIIDKFAEASHLIDEMTLASSRKKTIPK